MAPEPPSLVALARRRLHQLVAHLSLPATAKTINVRSLKSGCIDPHVDSSLTSCEISRSEGSTPFAYDQVYNQLDAKEKTRLLILEAGGPEDELKCQLVHVSTLHELPYDGLSYAWGDSSRTHLIRTLKGSILITASLFSALKALRLPHRAKVFWADGICINQEDKIERGRQVQSMREIYENANQVIIWLGEEAASDKHALAYLNILQNSPTMQDSIFSNRMGWRRQNSKVLSGGVVMGPLADIDYDQLAALLRREWFRRTWVVQEAASAKKAVVMYGTKTMKWEEFADVFMTLQSTLGVPGHAEDAEIIHSMNSIAAIETARRSLNGPLFLSLFHMVLATCYNECYDSRDKVYAILGLGKDWERNKNMDPDYTITMQETYKGFAIWDSKRNKNLRALSCASGPKGHAQSSMPSWTPDWTNIENAHPFVRYSDRTGFAASGRMLATAWHSHDGSILHAEGKVFDVIHELGSRPEFASYTENLEINQERIIRLKRSKKWLQECQKIAEYTAKGSLTNENYTVFARTMTCGLTGDAFPAPSDYPSYFKGYMDFFNDAPKLYAEYFREYLSSPPGVRGAEERNDLFKTHKLIESSLQKWTSKRRVCATRSGHLAVVPKAAQCGDIICVLYGGEVPYVLRPTNNGFYYAIRECYVDSIMHGEALSDESLRTTRFRLR